MERWKTIKGTKNQYSISDGGRVRNNKTKQILKTNHRINGTSVYERITISFNGVKKTVYLQVLVKHTFEPIDNPELYMVDHINHNTLDNRLLNLQYLLIKDNLRKKMRSYDSYKLYKSLIEAYGDKVVYQKLKSINYVDGTGDFTEENLSRCIQSGVC